MFLPKENCLPESQRWRSCIQPLQLIHSLTSKRWWHAQFTGQVLKCRAVGNPSNIIQKVCSKIGAETRSPESWASPLWNNNYCSLNHWVDLLQAFFTGLKTIGGTLSALYLYIAEEPSDNLCNMHCTSAGALTHPLESHPLRNMSDFIYFQSLDLIITFPAKINKLSTVRCLFLNERLNWSSRVQVIHRALFQTFNISMELILEKQYLFL